MQLDGVDTSLQLHSVGWLSSGKKRLMAYLYHIKLPGMSLHEGYIGISKCYETRWKQHEHAAHNLMSPYVVHQKMREHKGEYEKEVIFEGTVQEVLDKEEELRPEWMMGWNMAKGGGAAGSGWVQPDSWISNELWHPVHGEVSITKDFTATDWMVKYSGARNPHGSSGGTIGYVLQGRRYEYKGWQLRDAQLAKQVETWLKSTWYSVFMTNGKTTDLVYRNGQAEFWKEIGGRSTGNAMKEIAKGLKSGYKEWKSCDPVETPSRVFGTPEEVT